MKLEMLNFSFKYSKNNFQIIYTLVSHIIDSYFLPLQKN